VGDKNSVFDRQMAASAKLKAAGKNAALLGPKVLLWLEDYSTRGEVTNAFSLRMLASQRSWPLNQGKPD
jgi:hypothetical protein